MARGGRNRPNGDDRAGKLTDEELANLILDDAFVLAAAVKEPPAAERDAASPIAAPPRPPRLRLPAPQRTRAPFAWIRRRFATIVIVCLIAGMLAGSVGPFASRRPARDAASGADEPEPTQEAVSPFARTPAARFADDAAGLVIPSATAVEGMTTAEVALALHTVRRAIEAGNLDDTVLADRALAPYLDVVGPETQAAARAALDGSEPEASALDHFTRFPDGVRLARVGIKTSGTFSYRSTDPGTVTIEGRHAFVYPTVPSDVDTREAIELLVVRRDTEWRVTKGPEGIGPPELIAAVTATSGHCLVDDAGYVWPRFSSPETPTRAGRAVPVQWDLSEPLIPGTACFQPVTART